MHPSKINASRNAMAQNVVFMSTTWSLYLICKWHFSVLHVSSHTDSGNACKPQLNHSVRDWQTDRRRTAQHKHTVKINSHKSDHRKRQMSNWSCFSGKHLLWVISVHVTWLCIGSLTILQLVWQCCSVVCLYKSTVA